jgi:hypothetical protein
VKTFGLLKNGDCFKKLLAFEKIARASLSFLEVFLLHYFQVVLHGLASQLDHQHLRSSIMAHPVIQSASLLSPLSLLLPSPSLL